MVINKKVYPHETLTCKFTMSYETGQVLFECSRKLKDWLKVNLQEKLKGNFEYIPKKFTMTLQEMKHSKDTCIRGFYSQYMWSQYQFQPEDQKKQDLWEQLRKVPILREDYLRLQRDGLLDEETLYFTCDSEQELMELRKKLTKEK